MHLHERYIRQINAAVAGRPDDMVVTTHSCRGNFRSSWVAEGGYDFVAEALFDQLDVNGFFLEYDDDRSGGFEPLRFVPPGKRVVLGLVTTKRGALEDKDDAEASHRRGQPVHPARPALPVAAVRVRVDAGGQRRHVRGRGGQAATRRGDGAGGVGLTSATAALLSFRLGGADGVSVVAGTWQRTLERLGFRTTTVAGEGPVDRLVPGLAIDAAAPPPADEVADALVGVDLVVVENLLTIPLNLAASRVVAGVLRGRPALLHHHDPPWHRARFAHVTDLPADDPAWRHVAISRLAAAELAERGIPADVVYNAIELDDTPAPGDGAALRDRLGVDPSRPLLLHPVRAIERKDVPARAGARDRGRRDVLAARAGRGGLRSPPSTRLLAAADGPRPADAVRPRRAGRRVRRGRRRALPLDVGGLRHPPARSGRPPPAGRRRRLPGRRRAAGPRASAGCPRDDVEPLRRALADPAALDDDLAHNDALVRRHFSVAGLEAALAEILGRAGWRP